MAPDSATLAAPPQERTLPLLLERQFLAMGTAVLLSVSIGDESRRTAAERAAAEVQQLLIEFGREGWAWGTGALAQFNRALQRGEVASVPEVLQPLFARAWEIHRASGDLFEPRIGALVRLWGFDDMARLRSAPPDVAEIESCMAALRTAPAYTGGETYGPAPGVAWDLGAIGKGYIVDLALDWLAHRGFDNAVVNAGGNVAVRGDRGDRSWQIGIRDPRAPAEILAMLEVRDESVVTHGDDQRCFEYRGVRYAHLLHPRSGMPVQGLRSLTVVHRDGTLADGGGAALFAAGPDGWLALARRLGIEQVLVVMEDGAVLATSALKTRLREEQGVVIHSVD
ncbi:MAG TPA: FAD:protein FMN transferase [Nevskia sp.]|nr:FAD:protein FMN transferase [Nevskia sp.]